MGNAVRRLGALVLAPSVLLGLEGQEDADDAA